MFTSALALLHTAVVMWRAPQTGGLTRQHLRGSDGVTRNAPSEPFLC